LIDRVGLWSGNKVNKGYRGGGRGERMFHHLFEKEEREEVVSFVPLFKDWKTSYSPSRAKAANSVTPEKRLDSEIRLKKEDDEKRFPFISKCKSWK